MTTGLGLMRSGDSPERQQYAGAALVIGAVVLAQCSSGVEGACTEAPVTAFTARTEMIVVQTGHGAIFMTRKTAYRRNRLERYQENVR